MPKAILPGYDTSFGNKKSAIWDEIGPKSYPTGGITITAQTLGWGGFDWVEVGNEQVLSVNSVPSTVNASFSGTYFASVVYASTTPHNAFPKFTLKFFVVSSGAEVTNGTDLSAESFRIFALGV